MKKNICRFYCTVKSDKQVTDWDSKVLSNSFFLPMALTKNKNDNNNKKASCYYGEEVNFQTRAKNHCFIAYIINVGCKSQL